ncbi:GPW/gp25 family protein [Qipengyuania flava]|uniref:GPW/gp25 family protein n=1 Tax=Qipengyuania flava TaxID=192812 RepID=UPI002740119A|nr:GPW/gp25 family protein [Qipengyuania flava]
MIGINATTGKRLEGDAHLAQSIGDILSTPLGSRVMRRDYGSLLFELIDKPVNGAIRMLMHAATAIALRRWEPRLRLTRVSLEGEPREGILTIRIEGRRLDLPPANSLTTLTIPIDTTRGQRAQAAN